VSTRRRPAALTVAAAFRAIAERLRRARLHYGHGTHDARDEAAFLILHVLGLAPQSLAPLADRALSAAQTRRLEALVARRVRERVPAAYLLRESWLGQHRFYVDRRAIVPRSFIAELLRESLAPWLRRPPRRVLDLCTGSGCLAILAGLAFPRASIDASDASAAALAVARRNVAAYDMGRRLRLIRSDLFAALRSQRYDLILCNPPYVTDTAMRRLPAEYAHEPHRALAGGADGLALVRRVLNEAQAHLTPHGILVCEIGHNRRALERAFPRIPFLWPETSGGADRVFLLERADCPLRPAAAGPRRRATRPRASRSTHPRARAAIPG